MKNMLHFAKYFKLCRRPFASALFIIILLSYSLSEAYYLSYNSLSHQCGHAQFSLDSNSFSLSDAWNQYSESSWQVVSAVDDGNGGVNVEYAFNQGAGVWDSYGARTSFSFQILSDYGNLNSEPVNVEAWGGLYLDHEVNIGEYAAACCTDSDVRLEGPVWHGTAHGMLWPGTPTFDDFDDSFLLYSNTVYTVYYSSFLYVESWIRDLPHHFSSWYEYADFMAATGGSGGSYTSSQGSVDYNLVLRTNEQVPVPEPLTIVMLSSGLAFFIGLRRKSSHQ